MGEHGEESENDGDVALGVDAGDAFGHALADVVEVGCVALDDAAEDDDAVHVAELGQLGSGVDEFEATGHALYGDVLQGDTLCGEFFERAVEELVGDVVVPLGDYDAEAHFAGIGDGLALVGCIGEG